jgi:hypothetical protein
VGETCTRISLALVQTSYLKVYIVLLLKVVVEVAARALMDGTGVIRRVCLPAQGVAKGNWLIVCCV